MSVHLFLSFDYRQVAQGFGQGAAGGGQFVYHRFNLRFGGAVHPPP